MTRSTVRYRPSRSPWPGRDWESKCHRSGCETDRYAWTWHASWWHAMGRAWAHLREEHSAVQERQERLYAAKQRMRR